MTARGWQVCINYHVITSATCCPPAGVSVIEVVTSQMITYGLVALLQDIPEIIVGVYVFNVSYLLNIVRAVEVVTQMLNTKDM